MEKINKEKLRELSKELDLHDAGLIEQVLADVGKRIKWTRRQLKRIARIKKTTNKLDVMC